MSEQWVARLFDANTNKLIGEKFVFSLDAALDAVSKMERKQPLRLATRPFVAPVEKAQ